MTTNNSADLPRRLSYQLARACDALDHALIALDRMAGLDALDSSQAAGVISELDVIRTKVKAAESMVQPGQQQAAPDGA